MIQENLMQRSAWPPPEGIKVLPESLPDQSKVLEELQKIQDSSKGVVKQILNQAIKLAKGK